MVIISSETCFNADYFTIPVVGIAADMPTHDSGPHSHSRHQLLFSTTGCMTIEMEKTLYLLPARRAMWIPAGVVHRVMMRGVTAYRSLYFSIDLPFSKTPLQVFSVNALLFEIIERMSFWPWTMPTDCQNNILNVFIDELHTAPKESWDLKFPQDDRLSIWIEQIHQGILPLRLNVLAKKIGACERTISRIFIRDTGMNYQSWRQQWRLLKGMEMLADNKSTNEIAQFLDFSSDSAFIAFFRQYTGVTPNNYNALPFLT